MIETKESRRQRALRVVRRSPLLSFVAMGIALVIIAVALTIALRDYHIGIAVVAIAFVVLLAVFRPAWCLAGGCLSALAAGNYSLLGDAGLVVLVVAALVNVVYPGRFRARHYLGNISLPLILLLWITIRLLIGGSPVTARAAAACICAVILVVECARRSAPVMRPFGVAGILYVLVSAAFGAMNENGNRYEGLSGNPNRMVFGLLVLMPFILMLARPRNGLLVRFAAIFSSAVAVLLILFSGSSQGIAGLILLVLAFGVLRASALARRGRALLYGGLAVMILAAGTVFVSLGGLSNDLLTLSGRTPIFRAAFEDFLRNPLLGSGFDHVTAGSVVNRSTHDSILTMLTTGGTIAGILWLIILATVVWSGLGELSRRRYVGAAALALVLDQFVQTVQYQPLTWAVIALAFLSLGRSRERRQIAREPIDLLCVSRSFAPNEGGAERQLRQVVAGLGELGYDVTIVTQAVEGQARREMLSSHVRVRRVGLKWALRVPWLAQVLFFLLAFAVAFRGRPKILLSLQMGAASVAAALAARALDLPHIVRLTGGGSERFRSEPLAKSASRSGRLFAKAFERPQTTMVAPAQHLLADFTASFPQYRGKTIRIPNGVDLSHIFAERTEDVIWYSRGGSEKSAMILSEIAGLLPDISVTAIGRDIEIEVPPNVNFIGWQQRPEEMLGRYRVLLNTSSQEGMPNMVLQALASACRVVGFNNAGMRELAASFPEAMVLVDVGDAHAAADAIRAMLGARTIEAMRVPDTTEVLAEWVSLIESKLGHLAKTA